MLIKISKATDNQLNYLLAVCEGKIIVKIVDGICYVNTYPFIGGSPYLPITDYNTSVPIIYSQKIHTWEANDNWYAGIYHTPETTKGEGKTPIRAAMHCYIKSKFGETAEVPDNLF